MSVTEILLAVVTAITDLLGPAAGPLSGGLPVVALLLLIVAGLAVLPAAARADRTEASDHRG